MKLSEIQYHKLLWKTPIKALSKVPQNNCKTHTKCAEKQPSKNNSIVNCIESRHVAYTDAVSLKLSITMTSKYNSIFQFPFGHCPKKRHTKYYHQLIFFLFCVDLDLDDT